jgi:hypothetical protein
LRVDGESTSTAITGARRDHRIVGNSFTAIDQSVGLITGLVVDDDSQSVNKRFALNVSPGYRHLKRSKGLLLGSNMFGPFGRHGDDFTPDKLVASLLLGFGPCEEFRHGHAFDGGNVHVGTLTGWLDALLAGPFGASLELIDDITVVPAPVADDL